MQILRKQSLLWLDKAINMILPPRCVVTGETVEHQGAISPKAWAGLEFIESPYCTSCGFPFEYEDEMGMTCTSCLDHPPPFALARSAIKYNDTSRDLILGFKHADKTHVVRSFVPWMKRAGAEVLVDADYLVPVPLHYWRLVKRRYNQAAIIAQALGKDTNIPVLTDALRRTRSTPSQGHLNAKERHKNVRRAFAVKEKEIIKNKHIVLIDDVYTTGATIKECAKALKRAGAKKISVLTLARVVREGSFY